MKPRIFKKGNNTDGSARYVLRYFKNGKIHTIALNPGKLAEIMDNPNLEESQREND